MTKELFIESLEELEKQLSHDERCAAAFGLILKHDWVSGYDNHWATDQLTKILKVSTNDYHKDSWIDYFIWELDFGKKWKEGSVSYNGKDIKLQTAEDLWELIKK